MKYEDRQPRQYESDHNQLEIRFHLGYNQKSHELGTIVLALVGVISWIGFVLPNSPSRLGWLAQELSW